MPKVTTTSIYGMLLYSIFVHRCNIQVGQVMFIQVAPRPLKVVVGKKSLFTWAFAAYSYASSWYFQSKKGDITKNFSGRVQVKALEIMKECL